MTALARGREAAEVSRQTAEETFERGLTPECLPSVIVDPQHVAQDGLSVLDALVAAGLVGSKGEARRLVRGGGCASTIKS